MGIIGQLADIAQQAFVQLLQFFLSIVTFVLVALQGILGLFH